MRTNRTSRIVRILGAAAVTCGLVAASVAPAHAEGWQFVRKFPNATCFELLRNGEMYGLVNVCANNGGVRALTAKVTLGGELQRYCMPQNRILNLGLSTEYSIARLETSFTGFSCEVGPNNGGIYVL